MTHPRIPPCTCSRGHDCALEQHDPRRDTTVLMGLTDLDALELAFEAARREVGRTAPNPPVGAVALDREGRVLSALAHEGAGLPHAEARVIEDCRARGILSSVHTLAVTLEPCNHMGRTPPCTEAIERAGIRRVVYGARDPNPRVVGGGAAHLTGRGIETVEIRSGKCAEILAPFSKWVRTGTPYVLIKAAYREGTMVPPPGSKTFTSESSLELAHRLRRESDAILTGSGTVLSDDPEFTVRRVPDHPGRRRWLVVLDRRGRVPRSWIQGREQAGFQVRIEKGVDEALGFLGKQGVLQVLVEAGPTLTQALISRGIWDRHVLIEARKGSPDEITDRRNPETCSPGSSKV